MDGLEEIIREISMDRRIILLAIAGGLCTFLGIAYIAADQLIIGIPLLIIGILNAAQLMRFLKS